MVKNCCWRKYKFWRTYGKRQLVEVNLQMEDKWCKTGDQSIDGVKHVKQVKHEIRGQMVIK